MRAIAKVGRGSWEHIIVPRHHTFMARLPSAGAPMNSNFPVKSFQLKVFAVCAVLSMSTAPALAAACGTGSFEAWLADFKNEAAAKGISQTAIASALGGVTLDRAVLSRDQSQRVFSQ